MLTFMLSQTIRSSITALVLSLTSTAAIGVLKAHECLAQETLQVGVIQSLTGIAAEDGKGVVRALKLAAENINAKGTQKIELLIEDDGSQPKNAVTAMERLRARGVTAIIGATWDFTTNAIVPTAARRKLVVFNTSTLMESLSLSQSDGYGFINSMTTAEEAAAFATFLNGRNLKEMVIVFANNSWGETQLKVYKELAGKAGVQVVDEMRSSSYDANEWSTFITRIKQSHADLVLLLLNRNDLEVFLRRAKEVGLNSALFASKNLQDALNSTSSKALYEGVCFTYPMEQLASETEFRAHYKRAYGEDPRIYADNSYDALFIVAKAAALAKKEGISLKDALHDVHHDGLVGHYSFSDERSFTTGRSSLVCVQGGEARLAR